MFWNKKKKAQETVNKSETEFKLPPCPHTWKDFPAYIRQSYDGNAKKSYLTVMEPYVCVHCKKRKDVKLYEETETNMTRSEHNEKLDRWMREYKIIESRIIVEDMINDEILLDPVKLAIVDNLRSIQVEEKEERVPELSTQTQPKPEVVSVPSNKFHKGMRTVVWFDDAEGNVRMDVR